MPEYYTICKTIRGEDKHYLQFFGIFNTEYDAKKYMPFAFYEAAKVTYDSYRQFFDSEDGFPILKIVTDIVVDPAKKYYVTQDKNYNAILHEATNKFNKNIVEYNPCSDNWMDLYKDYTWIDSVIDKVGFSMDYEVESIYTAFKYSETYMKKYFKV